MTADAAMRIAKLVSAISTYPWPADGTRHEAWVLALASPHTQDIRDDVAIATVQRLVTEYAPDKLSPAQVVTSCRANPVYPPGAARMVPHGTGYRLEFDPESPRYLEDQRKRRQQLSRDDRAALARLFEAFSKRGEGAAFDHLAGTLARCGVEWADDESAESAVPF